MANQICLDWSVVDLTNGQLLHCSPSIEAIVIPYL